MVAVGGCLATELRWTFPPAPGLFSTTRWLSQHRLQALCENTRANRSRSRRQGHVEADRPVPAKLRFELLLANGAASAAPSAKTPDSSSRHLTPPRYRFWSRPIRHIGS